MKKILKWCLIVVAALVVIGLLVDRDPADATGNSPAKANEPAPPEEPPISVSADELLDAYKANEIAANQKFKGKKVIVRAQISAIEAGIGDEPYLVLSAGDQFEFQRPQARFTRDAAPVAATLKKGQSIKLQCVGNGEIAGTPMLKGCVVAE